ncbi:hypothetical protein B566_EDAN005324 [Ephemera danica]|nr:hypothetical protein B566_EDAN005324 [Ephemera danica]
MTTCLIINYVYIFFSFSHVWPAVYCSSLVVFTGVEMAVWGGRYKFEDTSVTRRDFTSPPYKRPAAPHDRISSAPTVTQTYWKQQQSLRPRDHFASPKPLMPGSAHRRSPCPLGCPCNQSQQPANFEICGQRENFETNRWSSNNKYNNCSASYMSSTTQTAPKYSASPAVFSCNPPPYQRDLRAHNAASAIHKVQAFQPQPAIPVGWGKVDLTTYLEL